MQTPGYQQPFTPNSTGRPHGHGHHGPSHGGHHGGGHESRGHHSGGGGGHHGHLEAAQSPSGDAPIDGKAFFRQARGRMPQESFNQFLASIKRLNNQQQSREDTLAEARNLFGPQNEDLYYQFEN